MTLTLAEIWRHPIKSHGRELVGKALLDVGKCLPYDRHWAVAHEASRASDEQWSPCAAFSRVSKAPQLMAISATFDEKAGLLTLTHPQREPLVFDPDQEPQRLIDWVQPLMPVDRAASVRVVRVPGRGMTDTDFPSMSLAGMA